MKGVNEVRHHRNLFNYFIMVLSITSLLQQVALLIRFLVKRQNK